LTRLQDTPFTNAFRVTFVLAILLISYLAVSRIEETVLDTLSFINDKIEHTSAFLFLAFLLDFAWPRQPWGERKWLPLLGYGLLIELVQYFIPYREFSLWDLAADALGLIVYPLLFPLLKRIPGLAPRWNGATDYY
jgi:VanZ family protein